MKRLDEVMAGVSPLPWVVGGPWPEVTVCAFTGHSDPDVGCDGREPLAKDFIEPDAGFVVRAANTFPALIRFVEAQECRCEVINETRQPSPSVFPQEPWKCPRCALLEKVLR